MNYSYFSYTRVIAAVAFFAGIIILWPGKLFFLNDDFIHLHLTSQGKWLQQNSFRPVCDLSMWIDYKIWKLNATGFHITNALLHLLATFLVYRLSVLFLKRYHQAAVAGSNAILIASIFFIYAFHAKTIYWVIGRSASLGAIFFLASLIHYLQRGAAAKHYPLAVVFMMLGLLTYESTIIMPLAFLVLSAIDVKQGSSSWHKELRFLAIAVGVFVACLVIRYIAIRQLASDYEAYRFLRFDVNGLAVNYLKLILRSFSKQTGDFYLIGSAFLIGVTAIISFFITKRRLMSLGLLLLWLVSYLPYLSLGTDTFGTEGERYLYLPSIFLCMILGLGIVNAASVYKYIISLLFFLIHILLLYDARKNYEVASAVTQATVREMNDARAASQFVFICLPRENKGALIFRDGIQQAAMLFADRSTGIKVQSVCEGNFESFHGTSEEDQLALQGKTNVQVTFDFSKNSLIISYLPAGTISE